MYILRRIREADRQFKKLPPWVQNEIITTYPSLKENPLSLPSWIDWKLIGKVASDGRPYWRIAINRGKEHYRVIYTVIGNEVVFVRFKKRPPEGYKRLPKL